MTLTLPKMGTWESFRTPETLELNCKGQTSRLEVFFISLENYQSVDVENDLSWAICTSTAQVMAKRRARSQIGNLAPNH